MDDWMKEFPAAITVCDGNGIVLDMNDRAIETFESDGGRALIGAASSTATRSRPGRSWRRSWPAGRASA
jgi:hypothetical protein